MFQHFRRDCPRQNGDLSMERFNDQKNPSKPSSICDIQGRLEAPFLLCLISEDVK